MTFLGIVPDVAGRPRTGREPTGSKSVLVTDPDLAARLRAEREASDGGKHDEVWDGVYVMSPVADIEHQYLVFELSIAVRAVIGLVGGGAVFNGVNVSDREEGWKQNYRVTDTAVVLNGNPAKNRETHWCGGPDFVMEILSPSDLAREKRPFYARIGVRELWVVDRDPWAVEPYRLEGGDLNLVGRSSLEQPGSLASAVLPLVFRLVPGEGRPRIEVARADGAQTWLV